MQNLMATKRFFPLFITQFMGVFNDNLFKNALVIMATYKIAAHDTLYAAQLANLAFVLYMLPSFLFSPLAGQVADKIDRDRIARLVKLVEIGLAALGAAGLFLESLPLMYAALFGFGMHSNFFGPIKFAILPQHLAENELATGNAYMEAGTFLAILAGTITGGIIVLMPHGVACLSMIMAVLAIAGYAGSFNIPKAIAPAPHLHISLNPFSEFFHMIAHSRKEKDVFTAILGLSWFWFVAALFLAQFSPFAKDVLFAHENVVTLFLTVFSVGIVLGSLLCGHLLDGKIHDRFVPYGALGLSMFSIDLFFSSHVSSITSGRELMSVLSFLRQPGSARILFDLLMISLCGGFYTVPLYTLMQNRSEKMHVARTMAANNMMNALFMIAAAAFCAAMLKASFSIPQVFLTVGILNGLFVLYYFRKTLTRK